LKVRDILKQLEKANPESDAVISIPFLYPEPGSDYFNGHFNINSISPEFIILNAYEPVQDGKCCFQLGDKLK
jgi:hypothetical protein